jgi:hypothetical protein
VIFAQPAILATWALLGSGNSFALVPAGLALSLLCGLAMATGALVNSGGPMDVENLLLYVFGPAIQFCVTLLILWLIQRFQKSPLGLGASTKTGLSSTQLSLRTMFAWISFIAMFLAAFMTLVNASQVTGRVTSSMCVVFLVGQACVAICTSPVAVSIRIANGNVTRWLVVLAVELLVIETLFLHVLCMILDGPLWEFLFVLLVIHSAAILTTISLRLLRRRLSPQYTTA